MGKARELKHPEFKANNTIGQKRKIVLLKRYRWIHLAVLLYEFYKLGRSRISISDSLVDGGIITQFPLSRQPQ